MLTIPDYRLRLPGPTAVPERVRQATALPVLNHRGAEFKAMLAECQQRLKPIFGTAHDILIFAGSGTAMMEAALVNVLSPGDAILIVVAGQFGDRFVSIAKAFGASIDTIDVEWGGERQDAQPLFARVPGCRQRRIRTRYLASLASNSRSGTAPCCASPVSMCCPTS
jgi:aspartate aminotransferase-like enzyme